MPLHHDTNSASAIEWTFAGSGDGVGANSQSRLSPRGGIMTTNLCLLGLMLTVLAYLVIEWIIEPKQYS